MVCQILLTPSGAYIQKTFHVHLPHMACIQNDPQAMEFDPWIPLGKGGNQLLQVVL